MKTHDVTIVGGGPAGYTAALTAARLNLSACLIERDAVGGMCLNGGCIPLKSLLASAGALARVRAAGGFGLRGISFEKAMPDWPGMVRRAASLSRVMVASTEERLARAGVEILRGEARVRDRHRVEVGDREVRARHLLLATGSVYQVPAELGPDALSPARILDMEEIPETVAVVGGGVVGYECACLFAILGSKVHVIEGGDVFIPYLDDDVRAVILRKLSLHGVDLRLGRRAVGHDGGGTVIEKSRDGASGTERIASDALLYCGRRRACLDGCDALLSSGLELSRGCVRTDRRARTSLPGVFAAGDVNGRAMLSHIAAREAQTAVETISGAGRDLVYDFMPYCAYGTPEIASVGLTERRAREEGFLVAGRVLPLSLNGRALVEGTEDGFVKILFDKRSREILGIHIVGERATELVSEAAILMQTGTTIAEVASLVHAHPTLSETILQAALEEDVGAPGG